LDKELSPVRQDSSFYLYWKKIQSENVQNLSIDSKNQRKAWNNIVRLLNSLQYPIIKEALVIILLKKTFIQRTYDLKDQSSIQVYLFELSAYFLRSLSNQKILRNQQKNTWVFWRKSWLRILTSRILIQYLGDTF